MKFTPSLCLLASIVQAVDLGYNSECQMDSECRSQSDLPDICCALLLYETSTVTVKKRECLPRSDIDNSGGKYSFKGVTTTDAYCDQASMLTISASLAVILAFF